MRTAGLTMNSVWAHRVLRDQGITTARHENLPADVTMLLESLEMRHHGSEENYRPYLHISGEMTAITFEDTLPHGIDTLTYSLGKSDRVDAFYEFDDEQLVALAEKGYFTRGFEPPYDLTGSDLFLPAYVDVLILEPGPADPEDRPIVFAQVHDIANLALEKDTSGYDFTEFFESVTLEPEAESTLPGSSASIEHISEVESLFTEDELALDAEAARFLGEDTRTRAAREMEQVEKGLDTELETIDQELDEIEDRIQAALAPADEIDLEKVLSAPAEELVGILSDAEIEEKALQQDERTSSSQAEIDPGADATDVESDHEAEGLPEEPETPAKGPELVLTETGAAELAEILDRPESDQEPWVDSAGRVEEEFLDLGLDEEGEDLFELASATQEEVDEQVRAEIAEAEDSEEVQTPAPTSEEPGQPGSAEGIAVAEEEKEGELSAEARAQQQREARAAALREQQAKLRASRMARRVADLRSEEDQPQADITD